MHNLHSAVGARSALSSDALRTVFEAQSILLEKLVAAARPPYEKEAVTVILREATEIALRLTGAEHASLILFDSDGQVTDSLLPRAHIRPYTRTELIERVMKEGLAGWVARHHDIGLVQDTRSDARWLVLPDQPYAAGSALCLPIISAEMLLGVLTLAHSAPGHFTPKISEVMRILVNQLALIVENANLFANLSNSLSALGASQKDCDIFSQTLTAELNKCRKMQMDFLPKDLPKLPDWELEGFFFPANRVSGDFYDAFLLPGGYLGLVIGDVCDKGVGAALFMALFRSMIRIFSGEAQLKRNLVNRSKRTVGGKGAAAAAGRHYSQVEAIRAVALANDYIAREHGDLSMFATLFFGILDPASGRLVYINGGHEPLILLNADGIRDALKPTGPAVGVFAHTEFVYKERVLQPGEILFGYTDGVIDARSEQETRFSKDRLMALLAQPAGSVLDVMGQVGTALFAHIGKAPQEDDITMLALRRKPLI
jgi:sigma-B regulation protein RsbU (phosphoserine phosphatase)